MPAERPAAWRCPSSGSGSRAWSNSAPPARSGRPAACQDEPWRRAASSCPRFFRSRDSSSENGSDEVAEDEQQRDVAPAAARSARGTRGSLPAGCAHQMIRNCENEKYAHSITNANISLPRSWKCRGVQHAGHRLARRPASPARRSTKANAVSPCPTISSRPKIVENQCGSSDITQSTAAKLMVSDVDQQPGRADDARNRRVSASVDRRPRRDPAPPTSCSAAACSSIQTAK